MKTFHKNILLYLFIATLSKCEELSIVCFASCAVYSDGVELLTTQKKDWLVPKKLNFDDNKLIAISVTKENSVGGLMIKSSPEGSYDTDGHRWRCNPSIDAFPKWNLLTFDDKDWPKADFIGFNGDCRYNQKFFAACVKMSEYASWIWHPSTTSLGFYCRMNVAKEGKGLNLGILPDRKDVKSTTEKSELILRSTLIFSVMLTGLIGITLIIIIIKRLFGDEDYDEEEYNQE